MTVQQTPHAVLLTQLIVESFKLNGHFLALGDELTKDIGLTSALWQVLHVIDPVPLPMAQIARTIGVTRQSVLRTVNVLVKKGFVALGENPHHQRAKLVILQEEGKKRVDIARSRHTTWANSQADLLDMEQLQATLTYMRHLREHITW